MFKFGTTQKEHTVSKSYRKTFAKFLKALIKVNMLVSISLYHTNAHMHHSKALFHKNLKKVGSTFIHFKATSFNTSLLSLLPAHFKELNLPF